ncbi:glycosyltransferase family 4 protein [Enterococcus lactis]|uniref:glycosyltransferase family 4 protein n=1 Tax=Enterococcus lactis TaxID=357441 RepID=UPI003D95E14C
MNILMVGPDYNAKGGMATVMKNFYEYYPEKEHLFFLISWKENHKLIVFLQALVTLRKLIKKHSIDIVHFHVSEDYGFYRKVLLSLVVNKKARTIFHFHSATFDLFYSNSNKLFRSLIRKSLNRIDQIVALTEEWRAFYANVTSTNICVMHNAVPIPPQKLYKNSSVKVVTLGRIGRRKGSYDIVKLAEKISVSTSYSNPIHFYLFGDGKEEKEKLKVIVNKKKIENVTIEDWLDDYEGLLQETAIHLLPSYNEGLPLSVLETMSYGIPNIASNIGGLSEVIKDGVNGFLVEPGDIEGMEKLIKSLLNDDVLRNSISGKSSQTIAQNFSLHVYFERWLHIYKQLAERTFR